MRDRTVSVMLGAGLFVLVAQLVVWLTPVRDLIVDTAEIPSTFDTADKDRITAPPTPTAEYVAAGEVVVEEPQAAANENLAQVSTVSEPGSRSEPAMDEAPPTTAETAAKAPTGPQSEVERDESELAGDEAPATTGEALVPTPAVPELRVERGMSEAARLPTTAGEGAARMPAVPEPDVKREVGGAGVTPPANDEATALASNISGAEVMDAVSEAADEPQPQASPAESVLDAESLKRKLSDPTLRKGVRAEDLAALEAFYAERSGPARWVGSAGLTPQARSIAKEIGNAEDWGLDASAFRVPPAEFRPMTTEDQAAVEVALDVAVLKYARAAQLGQVVPSEASRVLAQAPSVRDPKTVLTEIAAASAPDTYLTDMHPKHEQFARLREALLKAQSDEEKSRLKVNMDRWRWMPDTLGEAYVWLNIPGFMLHVVKDGKTIHSEKIAVGNPNSPTPALSADMTAIVFNPERVVPLSLIRRDVLPKLQERRGLFRGSRTDVLEQYQLTVRRKGKPVDPSTIDWDEVNLSELTFVQAPGPTNPLGKVKFLYPNESGNFLHEAIIPNQLARAAGRKEPRVANAEKLATLLLTDVDGQDGAQAKRAAKSNNASINLESPIPVHMTYFTTLADANGNVKVFDDIYDLDGTDTPDRAAVQSTPEAGPVPIPTRKPTDGGLASRAE